jgi:hypothetical protein
VACFRSSDVCGEELDKAKRRPFAGISDYTRHSGGAGDGRPRLFSGDNIHAQVLTEYASCLLYEVIRKFDALPPPDKQAILDFLRSL